MKNKDKKTLKKRTIEIDNSIGIITFTETEIESSNFLKDLILEETKNRHKLEELDLKEYYKLQNLKESNRNKIDNFSIWFGFIYIILVLISIIVMALLKVSLIYIAGIIIAFSFLIGATKFGNKENSSLKKELEKIKK